MRASGNIRKMRTALDNGKASYTLPLYDVLEPGELVDMTPLVGQEVRITFAGDIHCVVTGKKIRKAYGEGMSYDAFMTSPMAVESIIRPELSQAHLGIGLRDLEWEVEHHVKPHYVYISKTSGLKVGVTRDTQIPTRWIDQGAVEAVILAETPYRQAAGLIEVALKEHVADKTNWRNMLKQVFTSDMSVVDKKDELMEHVPFDLQEFLVDDDTVTHIEYPVLSFPQKVTSMKLDKYPVIEKRLTGIKGQYLMFEDDTVINLRSHSGYRITIES